MKKLLFLVMLLSFGCSKDSSLGEIESFDSDLTTDIRTGSAATATAITPRDVEIRTRTILGGVKNNPYEISNIESAYASLQPYYLKYGKSPNINITTTHKLLKFAASTKEQFKELVTNDDLILFDYPMNYKVIEMGDYYFESTNPEEIPPMWGIVDVNTSLPSIPYEVVEQYAYIHEYPTIIAQSFKLIGMDDYANDYVFGKQWDDEGPSAIPGPNSRPDCGEGWEAYVTNLSDHPDLWVWSCRRVYSNPQAINDCGCPIPWNKREPAGCVEVENDGGDEGVKTVKILIADSWLQYASPIQRFTDEVGCWRTEKDYSKNVWVWTKFQNEFGYQRSKRNGWMIQEYLAPIENYQGKFGEPHNNIYRHYPKWTQQDTKAQIYWAAASVTNQLQDYRDWVDGQAGVAQIPRLDIYLVDNRGEGAAILASQRPLGPLTNKLIPDITLGIFRGDFDERRESLDQLAYHEFTHASHFMQAGIEWYNTLINQELANIVWDGVNNLFAGDPHGDGDEPNAGHVALAESWADNIMTDILDIRQENFMFENGYIPTGLYEDLEDNAVDPIWRVRDNVMGYTKEQMSDGMNGNVTTIAEYRDFLRPLLPGGNNLQDFDNLFDDYIQ